MSERPWIVYQIDPIDFWTGTTSFEEYLRATNAEGNRNDPVDPLNRVPRLRAEAEVWDRFRSAMTAAKEGSNWAGDIREGPFVLLLPEPPAMQLAGFLWKEENNGTTYVVSEIALPWLDQYRA
jgi:hypothetical protein